MLADLMTKLQEMARGEAAVHFHENPKLPGKVFLVQGDSCEEFEAPPLERSHGIEDVASLVSLVANSEIATKPELFCGSGGVTAILGESRRETAYMTLDTTTRWQSLWRLRSIESMSIQAAVQLLRFDLHGTGVDTVITALRRVDFKRSSDGSSVVEHGRESLGRSVEAAVQQADQIPEEFRVSVPVYAKPGLLDLSTVSVRCGVYLDVVSEAVRIKPLADELESAQQAALGRLADYLRNELAERGRECPVFVGTP